MKHFCLLASLLLICVPRAAPRPLEPGARTEARRIFRQLVGQDGEGRQPVASLNRASSRITLDELPGRNATCSYLEVDKEVGRIVVEIVPGAVPTATGRFWVNGAGSYRVADEEWLSVFSSFGGRLDTDGLMSSHLRLLLNLEQRFHTNGQVGTSRRIPSRTATN